MLDKYIEYTNKIWGDITNGYLLIKQGETITKQDVDKANELFGLSPKTYNTPLIINEYMVGAIKTIVDAIGFENDNISHTVVETKVESVGEMIGIVDTETSRGSWMSVTPKGWKVGRNFHLTKNNLKIINEVNYELGGLDPL